MRIVKTLLLRFQREARIPERTGLNGGHFCRLPAKNLAMLCSCPEISHKPKKMKVDFIWQREFQVTWH